MKRLKDESNLSYWSCAECEYSSKKSSDVFKHVERVHLDLNYICPLCLVNCKSKTDLRTHCKKVHSLAHYSMWIVEIDSSFVDEEILRKMDLFVDVDGRKVWQCLCCPYRHEKKSNTSRHVEVKHVDFSVSCTLCLKLFSCREFLRQHMNLHKYWCIY